MIFTFAPVESGALMTTSVMSSADILSKLILNLLGRKVSLYPLLSGLTDRRPQNK